jgi:Mg/Co/Ni transporter MgtE
MQLSSGQIKEFFTTLDEKDFDIIYSQLTRKQICDFVVRLSPKEISSLSIYQLSKLDLDIFSKLSSQQFNAFSEKQVASFTTSQVNSFTDNQLYWSYSKLTNGMQRANFIRILNKEQLASIIKFLPKSSYAKVFNDANPRVLVSLINAVNDGEKEFIVGRLNALMISQIYSELPEVVIAKLRPDQKTFVTEAQLTNAAQE